MYHFTLLGNNLIGVRATAVAAESGARTIASGAPTARAKVAGSAHGRSGYESETGTREKRVREQPQRQRRLDRVRVKFVEIWCYYSPTQSSTIIIL